MTAAIAHRGPDGHGARHFSGGQQMPVGLGHRRLAIIDLSDAGLQPMSATPDPGGSMHSGVTVVFNGEIYNYRDLRSDLRAAGHVFRSGTDTEVLLHLYETEGLGMFNKLNGIFALAIHDDRPDGRPTGVERGALVLARDPLGVKPLYLAAAPEGMLFASEIKALLKCSGVSREINAAALHWMLAYLWTPAPHTTLASVQKVEPGCALILTGGRIARQWRYYELPYDGSRSGGTFETCAEELAARLETAVRRQLVSDVPVGAFLSGGLDSSAIVAMMQRIEPDRERTCFSIGFADDGEGHDNTQDIPYARRVAKHLGVNLVEIQVAPSVIARLPEMVGLLDEPQADPAPLNALMIAERSRTMGIPVLLSGAGGDDLFTGYRRHRALEFERRWAWLPGGARRQVQRLADGAASGSGIGQTIPMIRRLSKMFAYAGECNDRRIVSYFWWSTERLRRGLYSAEFAARVENVDTAGPLLSSLARIPRERDRLQRMLYLETKHFLADHNLNYTDRAGMAVGVEVRVPLLDLELVEFAARVPSRFKQKGRVGKAVFKKAMEPYLPHGVIYRPKSGFGAPLRRWLRRELRTTVEDTLNPALIARRGFFDAAAVTKLIEQDRRGAVDGSYTIFALMCLELWCRQYVD